MNRIRDALEEHFTRRAIFTRIQRAQPIVVGRTSTATAVSSSTLPCRFVLAPGTLPFHRAICTPEPHGRDTSNSHTSCNSARNARRRRTGRRAATRTPIRPAEAWLCRDSRPACRCPRTDRTIVRATFTDIQVPSSTWNCSLRLGCSGNGLLPGSAARATKPNVSKQVTAAATLGGKRRFKWHFSIGQKTGMWRHLPRPVCSVVESAFATSIG